MNVRIVRYLGAFLIPALCLFSFAVFARSGDWPQAPGPGEGWHTEKTISGMAAETAGEAKTPDGPAKVRLSFECTPGKNGTDSVVFIVLGATKLKGFDFDDFEGPDAVARAKALLTFTVQRTKGPDVVVKTNAAGSYTVTEGGFAFEVSTAANTKEGKVTQLTEAIAGGASSISVQVQDFADAAKNIQATFPTAGAAEMLSQTMKACSRH